MQVLLWGLQSPINFGMILRTCEVYRNPVLAFDPHGLTRDQGKLTTIGDFACGALQRVPPRVFFDAGQVWRSIGGRLVATSISADAAPAHRFQWRDDDCLIVGNEYDGLPQSVLERSGAEITIPMPPGYLPKPRSSSPIDPSRMASVSQDGLPNLNVAVATSIFAFLFSISRSGELG